MVHLVVLLDLSLQVVLVQVVEQQIRQGLLNNHHKIQEYQTLLTTEVTVVMDGDLPMVVEVVPVVLVQMVPVRLPLMVELVVGVL